jgi:hypothetical protein
MTIEVTNYISLMENDIRLNLCDKYAAIVLDNIAKSTDELINETGNSIYKLTTQSPDHTKRMAFISFRVADTPSFSCGVTDSLMLIV